MLQVLLDENLSAQLIIDQVEAEGFACTSVMKLGFQGWEDPAIGYCSVGEQSRRHMGRCNQRR